MYKEYTLLEFLDENTVCIPLLQRDYAQGRNNKKAEEVRMLFIDSIFKCMKESKEINLDFIYGYRDKEKHIFYPLDGQQRLTTLFLLYTYAYCTGKLEQEKNLLGKFSYEGRLDASDFMTALIKTNGVPLAPSDWHCSPTAEGMARTYKLIYEKFSDLSKVDLTRVKLIVPSDEEREFIDESTYWKMNARGRTLTDAEIFKSNIPSRLHSNWEKLLSKLYADIPMSDPKKLEKAESEILHYVKAFASFLGEKDLFEKDYVSFSEYNFRDKDYDALDKFFDFISSKGEEDLKALFPKRHHKYISRDLNRIDESALACFILLFRQYDSAVQGNEWLKRWLRFIINVTDNTVNSKERNNILKSIIDKGFEYSSFYEDLSTHIDNEIHNENDSEYKEVLEEESFKAKIIASGRISEEAICKAENHAFAFGRICFLLEPEYKENQPEKLDDKKFNERFAEFNKYFPDDVRKKIPIKKIKELAKKAVEFFRIDQLVDKYIIKMDIYTSEYKPQRGKGEWRDILTCKDNDYRDFAAILFSGNCINNKEKKNDRFSMISKQIEMLAGDENFSEFRFKWYSWFPLFYQKNANRFSDAILFDGYSIGKELPVYFTKRLMAEIYNELRSEGKGPVLLSRFNEQSEYRKDKPEEFLARVKGFYLFLKLKGHLFAIIIPYDSTKKYYGDKKEPFLCELKSEYSVKSNSDPLCDYWEKVRDVDLSIGGNEIIGDNLSIDNDIEQKAKEISNILKDACGI